MNFVPILPSHIVLGEYVKVIDPPEHPFNYSRVGRIVSITYKFTYQQQLPVIQIEIDCDQCIHVIDSNHIHCIQSFTSSSCFISENITQQGTLIYSID